MATKVDCDDVIVAPKMLRECIESVRGSGNPVKHDEGLPACVAPIEVMKPAAPNCDVPVGVAWNNILTMLNLIGCARSSRSHGGIRRGTAR
jgi:hypothetical protein